MTSQHPQTMIAYYSVRRGSETELREVVARHWPTAHAKGYATAKPSIILQGVTDEGQPFMIEAIEWVAADTVQTAWGDPAIRNIWERTNELCESRDGRPAVDFQAVEQLDYFQDVPKDNYTEAGPVGVAIYQIRSGCEQEFHELVEEEWYTLHGEGFMQALRPTVWSGTDSGGTFIIELSRWVSPDMPPQAFRNDRVNRLWMRVMQLTEGRKGRPASFYAFGEPVRHLAVE